MNVASLDRTVVVARTSAAEELIRVLHVILGSADMRCGTCRDVVLGTSRGREAA